MVFMSVAFILSMRVLAGADEPGDATRFVIAGAGPSTKVVELLAQEFCAVHEGYKVIVPPKSIKHKGGLEWVTKSDRLFGRTGRPLSDQDREAFPTVRELPIAKIKIGFAVGKELGVSELTLEQWGKISTGTVQQWHEVGGPKQPIILLGREPTESLLMALQGEYPSFGVQGFAKIYQKEDQMLKSIGKIPGAIGFSSKSNLAARQDLTVLTIDGLTAGLQVALVYDVKHRDAETVKMMKAFIESERWRKALEAHDFLPVTTE